MPEIQAAQTITLPLIGGFYQSRSIVADDTQCVNLYPEKNAPGSSTEFTDYLTPGLTLLRQAGAADGPAAGSARGGYIASNGQFYCCIGANVYSVDKTWRFFAVGTISTNTSTPVSMQDNGTTLVIVDGSPNGYVVDLITNAFNPYPGYGVATAVVSAGGTGGTPGAVDLTVSTGAFAGAQLQGTISGGGVLTAITGIADEGAFYNAPNGTFAVSSGGLVGATVTLTATANRFLGATRVDYIDTFLVFNQPNTRNFYSTLSNTAQIDPTYVASKTSYPDNIQTLIVNHRELWLLGAQKSAELWYDAGGTQFPFQIEPGVYVEQGCVAPYSVARHDVEIFWLSQNADGLFTVFLGKDYKAVPISTYAIADKISQYSVVSDAIGMVYQQLDHVFYVLTFPTANVTWVFDRTENLWHQRTWLDDNGNFNRIRPQFLVQAYGQIVAGDWETGSIYSYDINNNTDNGQPIVRVRTFPHLVNKAKRASYTRFIADMECGTTLDSDDYTITLSWSDDRGKTWSNPLTQSLGVQGEYLTWPAWPGSLGLARDKLFKLSWSGPGTTALNGAFVNVTPSDT
jgi:hypothetical protein